MMGAIGIQGTTTSGGGSGWAGFTGIIGATGIGGSLPLCWVCDKPTSSIAWVKAQKWPEWKECPIHHTICDICFDETEILLKQVRTVKPIELPLYLGHPNPIIRIAAARRLEI